MARMLIIGPSYKRVPIKEEIPAIDRYDGVFYRVTRKNLGNQNIKIMILTEDLRLIDAYKKIPYDGPKGDRWNQCKMKDYKKSFIDKMKRQNKNVISLILNHKDIDEIFIAAGAIFRRALPDFKDFKVKIILPHGGLGATAKSLKEWLQN
jgi:hypothetical protein